MIGPTPILCTACRGIIAKRYPGGVVRWEHKKRAAALYPPAFTELSCGQYIEAKGDVCGHSNEVFALSLPAECVLPLRSA